jgi:methylmalonyl-CoA mutase
MSLNYPPFQEKRRLPCALKEGFIQRNQIDGSQTRYERCNPSENLLGTNQFPNFTEKIESGLDASVFAPQDLTVEDAEIETLKPYRGAQAFEALRYKTDEFAKTGKRPMVFMLTIGNLAMRKARAQFACNFFAVAGFTVVDNNGFKTVEEGVEAAKKQAPISLFCVV